MLRKLFAAGLFVMACTVTVSANTAVVDEAPAPRPVGGDKKVDGAKGKFGGFGGGFGGKIDPEKLKEMKDKFGGKGGFGGKIDPEKLKEMKDKFGGKGGFGQFDPEKLKELKGKFGKEGGFPFPGGGNKGGFPFPGGGGFGKGKGKDEE
jgi:hypothetical protein